MISLEHVYMSNRVDSVGCLHCAYVRMYIHIEIITNEKTMNFGCGLGREGLGMRRNMV